MAAASLALRPRFSWDTVPVFYHAGNSSGAFSDLALDFIVGHGFPLVTVEKGMAARTAPAGTDAESKIVAAGAAIRARARARGSPEPMVLFYLNSVMNWDMYSLARELPEDLLVKDKSGKLARLANQTIFDLTKPAMRARWLGVVKTALATGHVQGVFADRGNFIAPSAVPSQWDVDPAAYAAGEVEMLRECEAIINSTGVLVANNGDAPGVSGRMFERWAYVPKDFDKNGPAADIAVAQSEATAFHGGPRVAEMHAGEPCTAASFNRSLAQYLVAASDYAYFGCTEGWSAQEGWDVWYPDYDRPLGAPKGLARKVAEPRGVVTWTREFASGTRARFTQAADVDKSFGCICWADGARTGAPGCSCDA